MLDFFSSKEVKLARHRCRAFVWERADGEVESPVSEVRASIILGRSSFVEDIRVKVTQWQNQRNFLQAKVDWRFSTDDARIKLKRLYPTLST